jgi:hypothetical protein
MNDWSFYWYSAQSIQIVLDIPHDLFEIFPSSPKYVSELFLELTNNQVLEYSKFWKILRGLLEKYLEHSLPLGTAPNPQ